MGTSSPRPREAPPSTPYTYRRDLEPRELLPALGAAVGAGVAVFYVVRLFLQRTPLDVSGTSRDHLSRNRTG